MTAVAQMLTVRVPLALRKPRGGRKLILTPGGMAQRGASAADTTLVKALARAFRCPSVWLELCLCGPSIPWLQRNPPRHL